MKRDMALIRRIMEAYENDNWEGLDSNLKVNEEHIQLLVGAGFVNPQWTRLTWKGYDWLDEQRAKEQPPIKDFGLHEIDANRICSKCGAYIFVREESQRCMGREWTERAAQQAIESVERQRTNTLLPHEPDESGTCKWCDKQILKPELNEVCRRRRGESPKQPVFDKSAIDCDC